MDKPFIIAEIAQGYEGSKKLAEIYVKAASSAGADAIKFQIFYADELALPDYRYYQLFKGLELPFELWERAVQESHEKGMEFYSDVFGKDSLKSLENIGADGYKIHTTDIDNTRLLELIAKTEKKVFLSIGGCAQDEVDRALKILKGCNVTLMYGFQAEPTELEDNNLGRIPLLKSIYGLPVGFQDHTAGDSEFALILPFVAIGLGVDVIEKHLTISRTARIEDYISALTPEEFAKWSALIREAYKSIGKNEWNLTDKEMQYRQKVRRAICTVREIGKGELIKTDDLILKRTDNQNAIFEMSTVVGKKAVKNIRANSAIEKGDIQ